MSKKLTVENIIMRSNSKSLDSIKKLNLYGFSVTDISALSKLPLLEIVSLSSNQIKDISVFKTLKNLKEIYLANNCINDFSQIENLKNCKKLEKLVLKGNPIFNDPNYAQKIIEILPNLMILDERDVKLLKNENNEYQIIKNKSKKINEQNKQISNSIAYKNINSGYKLSELKNDNKDNMAAPEPGSVSQIQKNDKKNINENINNNYGIVDPEVGNPKISAKTLEIFNKSFRKKKTEGTFFKLRKSNFNKNKNLNPINSNLNKNENDISVTENNNPLTTSRIEEDDRFKTLPTSLSLRIFEIDPNIKKNGYKKKIIGNYKNDNSRLNQSTYLKYQQFDNEDEEEKRKENSKEKDLNRSFYERFNTHTYNKKIADQKEHSFMINNSGNNNKKIKKNENIEKKDNNKKIMKSVQLLIGTLSLNGLKEVQSEVQKLLSNIKK